ncbi:E3 ubiquitin-protein ligase RING1-like protein [Morus notabilis]|uniref:E3 ubiquitin-protein ligase RING1-like protein n=1 Tax=Morus notabilis TaxID=981085 RepID=W9SMZ9_9ROSA|nr:E3 ubiquitin-protein ligase RING1-like protein [Morus notabilis]
MEGMFDEAVAAILQSAMEALKKFRYSGSIDDHDDQQSKLICAVCMEGVMIGSHVTLMPCSHMFHEYCILDWLERSQTYPICRFKLLIDNSS